MKLHDTIRHIQTFHKETNLLRELTLESVSSVTVTDEKGNRIDVITAAVQWLLELNRERNNMIKKIIEYRKK